LVERADELNHWQLPQGGINQKEKPNQAIKREMAEELGISKLKIIKYIPSFYKYKWPKINQLQRGYLGQHQDLFVLEFNGPDNDINLDQRELVNFKWVNVDKAVEQVHQVRKEQIKKAISFLDQ